MDLPQLKVKMQTRRALVLQQCWINSTAAGCCEGPGWDKCWDGRFDAILLSLFTFIFFTFYENLLVFHWGMSYLNSGKLEST